MKKTTKASTEHRIVVITGASSGIGKALTEEFTCRGDIVIAAARRKSILRQRARRETGTGGRCIPLQLDVTDDRALQRMVNAAAKICGRIDVLINNAGVSYFKELTATSIKEFDHMFDTNVRPVFVATRTVLPWMKHRRSGIIINILSYAAKTTYTKSAAYSGSKAAVEAMMNSVRAEVRREGVRVINVFPGAVETPMWGSSARRRFSKKMMRPSDIARLVYDLSVQPANVMVEEVIVRPQIGDLTI